MLYPSVSSPIVVASTVVVASVAVVSSARRLAGPPSDYDWLMQRPLEYLVRLLSLSGGLSVPQVLGLSTDVVDLFLSRGDPVSA
jgi:hypothetical protein